MTKNQFILGLPGPIAVASIYDFDIMSAAKGASTVPPMIVRALQGFIEHPKPPSNVRARDRQVRGHVALGISILRSHHSNDDRLLCFFALSASGFLSSGMPRSTSARPP